MRPVWQTNMAAHIERTASVAVSSLLLKVTPARVPRDLLVRQRLSSDDPQLRERPAIVVQAPAGFGKTSVVSQWRREHLARGTVVAWFSAQEGDDSARFVRGLALAVRVASGRPAFGHTLIEGDTPSGIEGVTAWLAEIAQCALDIVLTIDEAERLPDETRAALTYLIHNLPSNLRVVVAARPECDLGVDDLVPYGQCTAVGATSLRFELEETLALARARLGSRIDADSGARLHELTEGWALGLQLALSAVSRSNGGARQAIAAMAARSGELHKHFVDALLANLGADDTEFLTRISIVDDLHPDLCRSMTGIPDATERLARLARDTPLLAVREGSEWLRLHMVARDALRERFARLAPATRSGLQGRAAQWLAENGLLEEAARHALASGQRQTAYDYLERSLYDNSIRRGQMGTTLDWLARLPADELDRRPRLLLAAAWALAISERNHEAEPMVVRVLAQVQNDPTIQFECALIRSAAAGFADDPDRFAELHDPWAESSPVTNPVLLYMHANRRAYRALFEGDPAQARHHQQRAPRDFGRDEFRYVSRWGEFVIALSYIWEGQVRLAENLLRPALAAAENDLGRRHPVVCMLAALLATAVWESDHPDEAAALLANRLDVLARSGLPDAVMLGYRTAARIAAAEGAENRAFELLDAMHAIGLNRHLPRLCVTSLADQVRLHARRFRPETSRALCARIDALLASDQVPKGRLWRRSVEWLQYLSHANAAIAAQDWRRALEPLERAAELTQSMQYGRARIEVMALRAFALDRSGERSVPLLKEAIGLAQTFGLERLFKDAHPALGEWVRQVTADQTETSIATQHKAVIAAPMQAPRPAGTPRAIPSLALTPKEREVLELLARNLSNKEIARAMQIGEETIKWHLKNLFNKLDAGTRKQVVRRAEMLGLLEVAR